MAEFVSQQKALYSVSESSSGFIWRLTDPADGSGSVRPFEDNQILVGLSVWKDMPSLESFVHGPAHADFFRRQRAWFESHTSSGYVLWWVRAGQVPTIAEGEERLAHLRMHGPSAHAFEFNIPLMNSSAIIETCPTITNCLPPPGERQEPTPHITAEPTWFHDFRLVDNGWEMATLSAQALSNEADRADCTPIEDIRFLT